MQQQKPRRSYIRRKRCLGECAKIIKSMLKDLFMSQHVQMSDQMVSDLALSYAKNVEAHCWSPRLQISDECYRQQTLAKARELCKALVMKQGGWIPYPTPAPVTPPMPPPEPKAPEARPSFVQVAAGDPMETQRTEVSFARTIPDSGEDDTDYDYWSAPKLGMERPSSPTAFPFFK